MLPSQGEVSHRIGAIYNRWNLLDALLVGLLFFITVLLTSGFTNRFVFAFLKTYTPNLVTEGTLYDNMWIGGLTEPFSTKLWPLLFIGVFGLKRTYFVLLGSLLLFGASFSLLDFLGHPIETMLKFAMITFSLAGLTIARYLQSKTVDYPDISISHPWVFGAFCGFSVAISEFIWYIVEIGSPVLSRIPALTLHTLTGFLVIGTWVAFREAGRTTNIVRGLGILAAIAVHLAWNTWLVNQPWFVQLFL